MILGRVENRRKRIIKSIMNEEEERAFLDYFLVWKANSEISGKLYPNSVKNIDSNVGRYCNKFTNKNWLNQSKKYIKYEVISKKGKKFPKGQFVSAYRGNIKPFIDYFIFSSDDGEIDALFSNDYSVPLLHLFFELNEVRENLILFTGVTTAKPLNIYPSFLKVLDTKLISNWFYFERRFTNVPERLISYEEFFINKIPNIEKISKLIEKYLKDGRDDFDKFELREAIVREYDTSWDAFEKNKFFDSILKINKLQNKNISLKEVKKEIKIKYFARVLYTSRAVRPILSAFLQRSALFLISNQVGGVDFIETNPNLVYQLFKKRVFS